MSLYSCNLLCPIIDGDMVWVRVSAFVRACLCVCVCVISFHWNNAEFLSTPRPHTNITRICFIKTKKFSLFKVCQQLMAAVSPMHYHRKTLIDQYEYWYIKVPKKRFMCCTRHLPMHFINAAICDFIQIPPWLILRVQMTISEHGLKNY